MKNVTTHVGIDAHKKDLFIAMLIGVQTTPVTWQLANEPRGTGDPAGLQKWIDETARYIKSLDPVRDHVTRRQQQHRNLDAGPSPFR